MMLFDLFYYFFRKNYNQDYTYNDTEPVSANYYPVNSRIIAMDNSLALAVLTDRSEGGASLQDGEIELLVIHK